MPFNVSFWANQAFKLAGLAQIQAFGSLTKIAPPRMFLAFHILALANLESAQSLFAWNLILPPIHSYQENQFRGLINTKCLTWIMRCLSFMTAVVKTAQSCCEEHEPSNYICELCFSLLVNRRNWFGVIEVKSMKKRGGKKKQSLESLPLKIIARRDINELQYQNSLKRLHIIPGRILGTFDVHHVLSWVGCQTALIVFNPLFHFYQFDTIFFFLFFTRQFNCS